MGARGAEISWEQGSPEDGGVSADLMAEKGGGVKSLRFLWL